MLTLEPEDTVCRDVKIVLGAVAPTPIRARRAEEILMDKKIGDALIEQAARAASEEAQPITDVRASAEYRREMVEAFTRRALREVLAN